MNELVPERWTTYYCKTCRGEFVVPSDDTPVCCPVCRMNRIERRD